MPLREDILNPIAGDNPSGQNLRYAPIYDQIKEARREDDELNQGAWQYDRKLADWVLVSKLCQDAIATQSKDLQLAAWLCEALIQRESMGSLREGLALCRGLLERFWDTLYPELEDGDAELRTAPLDWVGSRLIVSVRTTPLCNGGYHFLNYKESRTVGFEEKATSKDAKAAREKALKEGKLAPEIFDRSFAETPKAFYADLEKQIDATVAELKDLNRVCQEKFADSAPSFSKLSEAFVEVRQVVHTLLQKKRETEPDPVEETPPEAAPAAEQTAEGAEEGAGIEIGLGGRVSTEPADKREAVAAVVAAATVLRKRDPFGPAAYLMLRGLRWGELRGSNDSIVLEAPPSDLRQQVKALATRNRGPNSWNSPSRLWPCRAAGPGSICSASWWRLAPRWATITTSSPWPSGRNCARC